MLGSSNTRISRGSARPATPQLSHERRLFLVLQFSAPFLSGFYPKLVLRVTKRRFVILTALPRSSTAGATGAAVDNGPARVLWLGMARLRQLVALYQTGLGRLG